MVVILNVSKKDLIQGVGWLGKNYVTQAVVVGGGVLTALACHLVPML
jgi:hypothetical protein